MSGRQTKRVCLTPGCNQPATGSRCPTHLKPRAHQTHHHGAAQQLRRATNQLGAALCAACDKIYHAAELEVDHITPLGRNGSDTTGNVQLLCRTCHAAKSATERHTLHIHDAAIG